MNDRTDRLASLTGYRFRDERLAEHALTHRSAGSRNNERLEYLGDAVLGLVVAEALFERASGWSEGDLSRVRASLVNRDALAELGAALGLGELLVLGQGELKSGGFRRKSILADAVEALIGAVYRDAGFAAARDFIHRLYGERLLHLPAPESLKDAKTRLQEWLQARGRELPVYELVETSGKAHEQRFRVCCKLPGTALAGEGEGKSRRTAEQAAAARMLERLQADE